MNNAIKVRESLALAYWKQAAGPLAAEATEAESVRDGILIVRTKSSVWSHELTLFKSQLLTNLNRILGGRIITDIVFRASGVKKKKVIVKEQDPPPQEILQAVELEDHEYERLLDGFRSLETIPNEKIRKVLATRMTLEAKLRHWRIERGWRVCAHCETLFESNHSLCPDCRI